MSKEIDFVESFCNKLLYHAKKKAKLYDGIERRQDYNFCINLAIEELGEVSSAFTRERYTLAIEECLDVAHTAILIALALTTKIENAKS